jgi:hypothetical protein
MTLVSVATGRNGVVASFFPTSQSGRRDYCRDDPATALHPQKTRAEGLL